MRNLSQVAVTEHPNQWVIFELWFRQRILKRVLRLSKHKNLDSLSSTLNFLLAFAQISAIYLSNFNSLSIVTPKSLTNDFFQVLLSTFIQSCSNDNHGQEVRIFLHLALYNST